MAAAYMVSVSGLGMAGGMGLPRSRLTFLFQSD